MNQFIFTSHPQRVVFGTGSLGRIEAEVDLLGPRHALILATPDQRRDAERIAGIPGSRVAGVFDRAAMHVPVEVAREERDLAHRLDADCAIAIGGGSTIGLGKAIAPESDLPILAIPTTYTGSEMTPIYSITEAALKKTGRDIRVIPKTVIYDPPLTYSLPVSLSISSEINAIAHAAEGLYALDANPITDLMAAEGITAIGRSLPLLTLEAEDAHVRRARAYALYGAWLCGSVLGSVGMSLHHKLCHTLGDSFNLPHALAYNATAASRAMKRIARALNGTSAP